MPNVWSWIKRGCPIGAASLCMASLASIVLAVCVAWLSQSIIQVLGASERAVEVARLGGTIERLDEVLSASAQMAAATGDLAWKERYDAHVGTLDATIASLESLSEQVLGRRYGDDVHDANDVLVDIERRAFEHIERAEIAQAQALLDGGDYTRNKRVYARGIVQAQAALDAFLIDRRGNALRGIAWAGGFTVASLLAIGVALRSALMLVRRDSEVRAREARLMFDAAAAKADMVARVCHEVRTPLTAILGYADIASDEQVEEAVRRESVETIRRSGRHLGALIDDLLDLSKLEAGAMDIRHDPVHLDRVIAEVVDLIGARAEASHLTLQWVMEPRSSWCVMTDELRLRQVLINLVANAVKFTPAGSVTIDARCVDGRIRVDVRDTGVGMTREQAERLFQPFAQGDASIGRRFGGTGLGLAISKALAEQLGGTIELQSAPRRGSTFTLVLPAEFTASPEQPETPDDSLLRLEGLRVLLADDGEDNRRLIAFHLGRAGAHVTEVCDGDEAVRAVRTTSQPFDLVVLDRDMPWVDGITAARQINALDRAPTMLMLSASTDAADRRESLAAGCVAYETKPVDFSRLIRVCHELTTPGHPGATYARGA